MKPDLQFRVDGIDQENYDLQLTPAKLKEVEERHLMHEGEIPRRMRQPNTIERKLDGVLASMRALEDLTKTCKEIIARIANSPRKTSVTDEETLYIE